MTNTTDLEERILLHDPALTAFEAAPEPIQDDIEYLSFGPGDVIVTGTPSGVGMAMTPPQALVVGDKVRVEIEGLGYIENEVIQEPEDTTQY